MRITLSASLTRHLSDRGICRLPAGKPARPTLINHGTTYNRCCRSMLARQFRLRELLMTLRSNLSHIITLYKIKCYVHRIGLIFPFSVEPSSRSLTAVAYCTRVFGNRTLCFLRDGDRNLGRFIAAIISTVNCNRTFPVTYTQFQVYTPCL